MKLIVNPHKIEIDKSPVNEREIDITKCEFEFADEITNDYVKEAYFTFNGTSYKQIIVNNECDIPSEVLAKKGQVEVGVVAFLVENEEEIKRYNPSPAYFNTWLGSLKDNAENSEPITPSEMEQFEQALNDGLNEVANVDIDAEQTSTGGTVTITNRYGEEKTVEIKDGEKGETGATPNIQIGTVVTGDHSEVTRTGTNENPIFNFVLEKGDKGDTGNGIASVTKTSTSGLVDTYTITYTNGTTTTFNVTNGKSISNIAKTSTSGLEDTYTITYNDNTTSTFTVTNGNGISSIEKTGTQDNVDTYTITYTNGTTSTFTVTNSTVTNQEFEELKVEHEELVNTLPRVEGTGESITLDNTAQYKMNVALSGNTSQVQYTGKNLFDKTTATANKYINSSGELGNSTNYYASDYIEVNSTNIYVSGTGENAGTIRSASYDENKTFIEAYTQAKSGFALTLPNNAKYIRISIRNDSLDTAQVEQNTSSATSYEPYVGGVPSPNPSYPQPIKKVTGDNTITVCGKNLFNPSWLKQGYISNSVVDNRTGRTRTDAILLEAGTYTFHFEYTSSKWLKCVEYTSATATSGTFLFNIQSSNYTKTITLEADTWVRFGIDESLTNVLANSTIQLELGSTATSYEPYQSQTYPINLGSLEYCKIGNYSDEFALSTGVQLFDKNNANILNAQITDTPSIGTSSNAKTLYIPIVGGITYTISKIKGSRFRIATTATVPSTATSIIDYKKDDYVTNITITASVNSNYLLVYFYLNGTDTITQQEMIDSIMINEGSTPLPWQPYGIGNWYLKRNIGKAVLDGTENWDTTDSGLATQMFRVRLPYNHIDRSSATPMYSNYYLFCKRSDNPWNINNSISYDSNNQIRIKDNSASDLATYKIWLASNNTPVYYPLETPIGEPITDTTLIEQLNNLYNQIKSYKGQTNITQTNAELPFNIDASALYDLNNLISRVATLEVEV